MAPLNPKISVVIPSYNHARFLPQSIESALGQTLKPYEVTVVDDGSTDNTREVVAGYPVEYLLLNRAGPSGARNAAIRKSQGDWIAFLDADDYWLPQKLERQVATLGSQAFCYCATNMFFTDGHTEPRPYYEPERVKKVLRHQNCIDPSAVLVRKDALLQVGGFNESIIAGEDWELWLKLARITDFAGLPDQLLMYRVTGTGLGMDPEIVLRSIDTVVKACTEDLPPFQRFIHSKRMRSVRTALAAVKYRDRKDYENTLRYAARAFSYWPSPFYDKAFKVLMIELRRRLLHRP